MYGKNQTWKNKTYQTINYPDKQDNGVIIQENFIEPGAQSFRNEIAARALQGLLSNSDKIKTVRTGKNLTTSIVIDFTPENFVSLSFAIADEFIKQSNL